MHTGSSTKVKQESQSVQPLPIPGATQFSQDENIDDAFTKLSAVVTNLIRHANFNCLQRACIEKARSPKMLHKSNEVVPVIKEAESFETLCTMLSDTTYWNFLDIRMLEAMATASMIPAAKETIENFKKTFFSLTLKEAAPYFPIIKVKPDHTKLHENLDRDPSQMTIGELHEHRFYLETKILKTGPDTFTICEIKIGSVEIVWQIHVDHAYQVHSRLKGLHSQLTLQAIRYMSIPAIEKWEGLPFLWYNQEMGEIGPIKSSSCVRYKPYSLPQGYEWSLLDSNNFDEVIQLYKVLHPTYPVTRNSLKWLTLCPKYKKGCFLGVRLSSSKMLMGFIAFVPCKIRVGGELLSMVTMKQLLFMPFFSEQLTNQIINAAIKETMRILELEGIFQAALFFDYREHLFKFNITQHGHTFYLHSLPYSSLRTVGLRRMKASDVPEALTLTNQYTSQFEIAQVFQSEEEFTHWFLSPLLPNTTTYVVEDPNSGSITDLFSIRTNTFGTGNWCTVIALVITKTSAEQILTDLLVCAKQTRATFVGMLRFGLKEHLFEKFHISNAQYCLFYNYKYPHVDNHCLFEAGL